MATEDTHPLDFGDDPLRLGVRPAPGEVWLVGAGPGDAGLVTIRGWSAILAADVVVHDRLGCEEILARLPGHIRRVNVGKLPGERAMTQERIHAILVEEARSGARVVRLKGGDPFVFGRGSEEVAHLRALSIPVRIVPGVTSAIAAPGAVGVPVTHRAVARSFVVCTGRDEQGKLPTGIAADTHLYLMGIEALPEIVASLLAAGRSPETPVVIVANASTYRQFHLRATLATAERAVRSAGIQPPAVVLIGETAGESVAPHLVGNPGAVLVTGSRIPAAIEQRAPGAPLLWRPLFAARFRRDSAPSGDLPASLATGAWTVFHGVPSVEGWLHELQRAGLDLRQVRCRLAAVGAEAARTLERWHLRPDVVWAADDAAAMCASVAGQPTWLATESGYRGALLRRLEEAGAAPATLLPVHDWEPLDPGPVEWRHVASVTLTSPRSLRRFPEAFPDAPLARLTALCVGNDLMTRAREMGFGQVVALE